jgi:Cu+-exporting ATPase
MGQAVADAGSRRFFEPNSGAGGQAGGLATLHLAITGMHCAPCSARVERCVARGDGVSEVTVNLAAETATILYDPGLARPSAADGSGGATR